MAIPPYTLRVSFELRAKVEAIAEIYGSRTAPEFIRELLGAVCSGDLNQAQAFQSRLAEKLTGQMQLEIEAARNVGKPAVKAKSRLGQGKGGRHVRRAS
jgi:hypothetical protein